MDQIEEVKRKTDIVALISEYVGLKKAGRNYKALCPFHSEKTPSFMVSPQLQIFKCFGCMVGGDAYRFLIEYEKVDFGQALKILADRAGVKLKPFSGSSLYQEKEQTYKLNLLVSEVYHYLLTTHSLGREALGYLANRGIKKEAIEVFKLGFATSRQDMIFRFLTQKKKYAPEALVKAGLIVQGEGKFFDRFRGRVIFPLKDHFGNVLGFSGRVVEEKGEIAKYINTPDTPVYKKGSMVYGLDVAKEEIKKTGFTIVVEGEFDLISSWQSGVRNVVAIKGSSLTEDQVSLLSRFCPRIVLALDADLAGDRAARRGIEIAGSLGLEVQVADLASFKDPDEMAQKSPSSWKNSVLNAQGVYDFLIDSAFEKYNLTTTAGKAAVSRILSPVLAGIEDEIVKAHCVKVVAERLGVGQEAVYSQISRQKHPWGYTKKEVQPSQSNGHKVLRRDVLEKYLLTLIFQTKPQLLEDKKLQSIFKNPPSVRLIEEYGRFMLLNQGKEFDPAAFAANLPGELTDLFASVILSDIHSVAGQGLELDKEVEKTEKSLKVFNVKEEMAELTQRIKEFEQQGKQKEIIGLEERLEQASKVLYQLEN